MAEIACAYIEDQYLRAIDEDGRQLFSTYIGGNCKLLGYTTLTVAVRDGNYIKIFDDSGRQISSTYH